MAGEVGALSRFSFPYMRVGIFGGPKSISLGMWLRTIWPCQRRRQLAAGGPPQWVWGGDRQPMQTPIGLRRMHETVGERERMGVRVGGDEAREEADLFARYEDEGDDGDQPHISPKRS
ncbi:hypothetical protein PIB30_101910 [Stylosanthes scabra]|uniref:Uncharacterized protein n=1 Tax=Stylosanthes scabra TaxID=79078 RepID=A0ABU6V038_9FABA|nr:hypothetical protein [Stylosanthes scabra]